MQSTRERFYFFALVLIVGLLGYLSYLVVRPFLTAIGWAVVFSVLFYPVHVFVSRYVRVRSLAALVTVIIVFVVIAGPVSYLSYLLGHELATVTAALRQRGQGPVEAIIRHPGLNRALEGILSFLDISQTDLQQRIAAAVAKLDADVMGRLSSGVGNVMSRGFDFVFMFLTLFFFLRDGPAYLSRMSDYLPFSAEQKGRLIRQTRNVVVATIYGGVTVALIQGIIGGFAFLLLGIPAAVLWGVAMFVTSFIPVVGTFTIWGPAAVYLIVKGFYGKAVILVLVGVFGISMVDNIVRPLVVRGRTKMPTLIIFFSILGGINSFGFIGFVMGPLVVALFLSTMEIFRTGEEQRRTSSASLP